MPGNLNIPDWHIPDLSATIKKKPPVDPANPCGISSHVTDGFHVQTGVNTITCYACLKNILVPGHYQKFRPPLHKLQSRPEIRFKKESKSGQDMMAGPDEEYLHDEDMDEQ